MKKYEFTAKGNLLNRMPVVLRIDGKAFHTFTKGFKKPFDYILVKSMQQTMKYLCENIQGCVLGYQQSDEISLVLIDYKNLDTCAWFDYNIQKCASVAASMATLAFNRFFEANVDEFKDAAFQLQDLDIEHPYLEKLYNACKKGAMFDARIFNIPKEEVTNYILWRQNDATRNSIEMVGHTNFSQTALHKKNCNQIQDMLMLEKGINWNNFPTTVKRGSCCIRTSIEGSDRKEWIIDNEIPIFKGDNRCYIDNLIYIEQ